MMFTADFETTTDENDCRVWAWAVCEIGNISNFHYGNSLDGFFEFAKSNPNSTYYFHNAKFDSEFLLVWLFEHGFKHVVDKKELTTNKFSTLISGQGLFYSMKVVFEKKGKKTKYMNINDSLKILPFSVSQIAKAFDLPISKLEIDYKKARPVGHELTPVEIDYIKNDVEIVARALKILFDQNLTKLTQGSNALFDYKNTVGLKNFNAWFPSPDYDSDIRSAYKGGFTYLCPQYKEVDLGEGIVFDVNSLYPWVLHDCPLPYGDGIYFDGEYQEDPLYNLYVQMFTCQFDLKEGYLPTLQLKNYLGFNPTKYVTTSGSEEVTLCLTSVDLKLFLEHYEALNITYHSGWKFRSATGLFTDYIDKWMKIKAESTINGNKAMRTLSKLMMNALYGKFATSPKVTSKHPYYDDGVIKYLTPFEEYKDEKGKKRKRILYESKEPVYLPVGLFVTAWARHKTISSAQKVKNVFIYADTDSLHLNLKLPDELKNLSEKEFELLTTDDFKRYGIPLPDDFIIDPVVLGAWKAESRHSRARFIRAKTYIEDQNPAETWDTNNYDRNLLKVTCAGMPSSCHEHVTWENFHEGMKYAGKLQPKHVKGGIVLKDVDFTITPGD